MIEKKIYYVWVGNAKKPDIFYKCLESWKKNLPDFGWLPNTCAYRLLYEGKALPEWHPLVSGDPDSVKKAGVLIQGGVHEEDVIDWFEFVIETE